MMTDKKKPTALIVLSTQAIGVTWSVHSTGIPQFCKDAMPKKRTSASEHFWSAIDWTKTNQAIASETKYTSENVHYWRKRLGFMRPAWHKEADWSKLDMDIASHYGIGEHYVGAVRKRLNKCKQPNRPRKIRDSREPPAWYQEVDWSERDVDIAAKAGVTRERARQVRITLDKPGSLMKNVKLPLIKTKFLAMADDYIQSLTIVNLSECLGVHKQTVYEWLKSRGIKAKKNERVLTGRCHFMDFRLPSKDLNRIWGVANTSVHRTRQVVSQQWGRGTDVRAEGVRYDEAIAAQVVAAKEWEDTYGGSTHD